MNNFTRANERYRPNVCGLIFYSEHILVCERADFADSWQFPQGGIENGEDVAAAFYREMNEELNYDASDFKSIEISGRTYRYEFPSHAKRSDDKFVGQEQHFVRAQLGTKKNPKLNYEFRSYLWTNPNYVSLLNFSFFKKETTFQALRDFKIIL